MPVLSRREMQVAKLICDGKTTREISALLGISNATAAMHRRLIYAKTGVNSIALLVRWYLERE
jgi:two-component system response regulator FixJ